MRRAWLEVRTVLNIACSFKEYWLLLASFLTGLRSVGRSLGTP